MKEKLQRINSLKLGREMDPNELKSITGGSWTICYITCFNSIRGTYPVGALQCPLSIQEGEQICGGGDVMYRGCKCQ